MATALDRGYGPDPHPDDPWSWTRVVYRPIEGFPGYCVGSDATAWTCRLAGRPAGRLGRWRKVKLVPGNRYGHLAVHLARDGRIHCRYIHRLVLEAFIGPCPPGLEACHNDGDRVNNRLGNLRWDTHRANMEDRDRHGATARGSRGGTAKLREVDIPEIRQLRGCGLTMRAIGDRFGVSAVAICKILTGKAWTHV